MFSRREEEATFIATMPRFTGSHDQVDSPGTGGQEASNSLEQIRLDGNETHLYKVVGLKLKWVWIIDLVLVGRKDINSLTQPWALYSTIPTFQITCAHRDNTGTE